MKLIKLAIISVLLLLAMVWGIALLFPRNTVVSRVVVLPGKADSLMQQFTSNEISVQQWLAGANADVEVKASDIPFYTNDLYNPTTEGSTVSADTLFLQLTSKAGSQPLQGGLAFYQLSSDSTTTQLFYVFQTPWYQPHVRWKMMMADKAMGPAMDSLLQLLKKQ